jgi:hypothetical protein
MILRMPYARFGAHGQINLLALGYHTRVLRLPVRPLDRYSTLSPNSRSNSLLPESSKIRTPYWPGG